MTAVHLIIAICLTTIGIYLYNKYDIYWRHNKMTMKTEFWISWWSNEEQRIMRYKFYERSIKDSI